MSKDIKALIRGAKLPECTVPVCLNADLTAEFERAERELSEATQRPADSLAAGGQARQIAERIEALRAEMVEHTIDFRLRAMQRPRWKAFVAAHPPRRADDGGVHERDRSIGVNTETFFDALIRASVVEPELDDEDWSLLLDEKLTDRQVDQISDAAWSLNRREVDVPFSRAASRILNSEPE